MPDPISSPSMAVVKMLSDDDVYQVLTDFHSGMTRRKVCDKWGISLVSLKNYRNGFTRKAVYERWRRDHAEAAS